MLNECHSSYSFSCRYNYEKPLAFSLSGTQFARGNVISLGEVGDSYPMLPHIPPPIPVFCLLLLLSPSHFSCPPPYLIHSMTPETQVQRAGEMPCLDGGTFQHSSYTDLCWQPPVLWLRCPSSIGAQGGLEPILYSIGQKTGDQGSPNSSPGETESSTISGFSCSNTS